MNHESETPARQPLPVRDPGATLRDNPIPDGPDIQLDHHAHHCFTDPTDRDTP